MTTEGYVWIVSEQALEAQDVPEGILGLRLINATNEKAHINDSLYGPFVRRIVSEDSDFVYLFFSFPQIRAEHGPEGHVLQRRDHRRSRGLQ